MKIKTEKPQVENILNQLISFAEKRDNTQITSHILITANSGLILKATDKEIGLKIKTDANIIKNGEITINGRKFLDIIKTLKNKEVEIEENDGQIIIKQDNSIYQLTSFNTKEFPKFPDTQNLNKLEIKIDEFIDAIKKIYPVIDTNIPKYELNGALFDLKENSNFVSTDTRRLAIYYSNTKTKEKKIIIPKRSLAEIKRILKEDMKIYFNENYLILENNTTFFFTKLINGNFPIYEKIVPKELSHKVTLPKDEFLSHLKQVSIISSTIRITIDKEKIEFETISDETTKAKTSFEIQTNIENFNFTVNSRYILDFLHVIDSEYFILELNKSDTPFILKDKNFITIIMPLNI